METWKNGEIVTWRHVDMETRRHGNMRTWTWDMDWDKELKYQGIFLRFKKQILRKTEKRKPRFSSIHLPYAHGANRSMLFVGLLTKKQRKLSVWKWVKWTCPTMVFCSNP
jgi:hypothetical protein